jgi:hypothetical protein
MSGIQRSPQQHQRTFRQEILPNVAWIALLASALPTLVRPDHAQAATVFDHPRTLPQGDGRAWPAFAGSAESGEGKLVILDTSNVLHDALAIGCPGFYD